MLPEENQIEEFVYEAKKITCPLGTEIEKQILHPSPKTRIGGTS
jgi:hypothetical protein